MSTELSDLKMMIIISDLLLLILVIVVPSRTIHNLNTIFFGLVSDLDLVLVSVDVVLTTPPLAAHAAN